MYSRGAQAWCDSRDLENGDTRCNVEDYRHEIIRERTLDDSEGPRAVNSSPIVR